MARISVVIPSYNSHGTIERTLRALRAQTKGGLIADIVVVDSSDDGKTPTVLEKYTSEGMRVIRAGERVMPALGRNIGAQEAGGDLLAFVDADAYPCEDWIEKINGAYEEGCLVGGGSVGLPDFQKNSPISLAQFFLQFNEFTDVFPRGVVRFVPSCNLFCEKALFEKIGGFPILRAAEDVVFGLRAALFAQVWFIPAIRVRHIFRRGWGAFLRNQTLLGRYVLAYRRLEDRGKFYYQGFWPLVFLPVFLAVKLARIVSRVMRNKPTYIARYLWCLPWFFAGLSFWAAGFAQEVFHDERHG